MRTMRKVIPILLSLLISACAHYPVNPQLEKIDSVIQKAEKREARTRLESDELLLIRCLGGLESS